MKCPCENCVVLAMCLNKSLFDIITCKLIMQYVNIEDVYQKHSRLTIVKTLFNKHDVPTDIINSLIQDIETFMDYNRKRNSHL